MNKIYLKRVFAALVVFMAAMPMFAADVEVWTAGKIQAVVDKVEDNVAGKVYASVVELTSEADIAAVDGFFQAEPEYAYGNAYASTTGHRWYFYAKANPGYKFVGFASSKTGNPTGSNAADNLAKVGDYYTVSVAPAAPYKAYPQDAPKLSTRYAVFEKVSTGGEEGGEGGEDPILTNIKATGALYAKTVAVTEGENTTGVAQYVNLVGATLVANGTEDATQADQVTHIYVTFDDELANISMSASQVLSSQISLINTTNGKKINFNKYNCVVWSKDNKALDLMISSEDYINNLDYQGVYEFKLPAGVVKSAKGAVNDAYEFTFTYGDPEQAKEEVIIDLNDYLGVWKQKKDVGEQVENPASFNVEKVGDNFYVTNLYGDNALSILIVNDNNNFTLAATSANGYSFGTMLGGAVEAKFTADGSTLAIMLEQFKYVAPGKEAIIGGECYFTRTSTTTGINTVESNLNNQMFDLQGRRVATPSKGLYIINGKKYIVK